MFSPQENAVPLFRFRRPFLRLLFSWIAVAALLIPPNAQPSRAAPVTQDAMPFDEFGWLQSFGYPGISGFAYTAEVAGTNLYVGGRFESIGGITAGGLAKYDGTTGKWSGFGLAADAQVYDILVANDQVYAAGWVMHRFLPYGVAVWDGNQWAPLGGEVGGGAVYSIAFHQGQLYAAGSFTSIGGTPLNRIARWNGSQWEALGAGLEGAFGVEGRSLLSVGNRLYVGGDFERAGGVAGTESLAYWQDGQWGGLGNISGAVSSLAWDGASLYVGGQFYVPGLSGASGILRIHNGQMYPLAGGLNPGASVRSLLLSGGGIYFSGGGISAGLYANGGATALNNVGYFDGNLWYPVGAGLGMQDGTAPDVSSLWHWQDKLVAAGNFTNSGSVPIRGLALWNGADWRDFPLSQGIIGGVNGQVSDMAVYGGQLYVAGGFTSAGDQKVPGLARWDGNRWYTVGDGSLGGLPSVRWITANASGIYMTAVTGQDAAWGDIWSVVHWNGSQWRTIGSFTGMSDLLSDDNSVYIYGLLRPFGPENPQGAARWDGNQWFYYPGAPFYVGRIDYAGMVEGVMYACGHIDVGGIIRRSLMFWATDHWQNILPALVEPGCLWSVYNGALYMNAEFREQGEYGPILVETATVEVRGTQWRKVARDEAVGPSAGVTPGGARFLLAASPYPPQFADPNSIYPPTAALLWAPVGEATFRPVPNSESINPHPSTQPVVFGEMLVLPETHGNLLGWKPPSADIALALRADTEVKLGESLTVTGTVSSFEKQPGVFVRAEIERLGNGTAVDNGEPTACVLDTSFACYWRSISRQAERTFSFGVSPTHLGQMSIEMGTKWSGQDTKVDNNRANVTAKVYKTFAVTPSGGFFSFPFSSGQSVGTAIPTGTFSATTELRIGWTGLPGPKSGWSLVEPVFELRENSLRRAEPMDFSPPISATIQYEERYADWIDESTLTLMRYEPQSQRWVPSYTDCPNPAADLVSIDQKQVRAYICRSGAFALVGQSKPLLFMPRIAGTRQ